jgi:hypothetical protein
LDERDSVLLLAARFFCENHKGLGKFAVYDCFLGIARDFGTGSPNVARAVKHILTKVCTVRSGRRSPSDDGGPEDVLDKPMRRHLCNIVRVAVADGGPAEQKALFLLSPLGVEGGESAFFPNLRHILRDRAHRMRSCQKGSWEVFDQMCHGMLSKLITGKRSFARMLRQSRKHLANILA